MIKKTLVMQDKIRCGQRREKSILHSGEKYQNIHEMFST